MNQFVSLVQEPQEFRSVNKIKNMLRKRYTNDKKDNREILVSGGNGGK